MAVSRPFSINTGSQINGTDQVGQIAVGYPTAGFLATGLKWWNGPDEDLGYVIALPNPTGQMGADETTSYLGFWRSTELTDASFIQLGNNLLSSNFTTANEVKTALNTAGFWTSYGISENPGTNSGVTLTIQESGADVVWSYSGSLDLSNLTFDGTNTISAGFNAGAAIWAAGPATQTTVHSYSGDAFVTFPADFGGAGGAPASTGIGDILGVIGGGLGRTLLVPDGYVSNTLISGSTTYINNTLSSIGLTEGSYTYSWGSGTNESITVLIGGTPSGTSGNSGSGLGEWSFYSDEGAINTNPPMLNGNLIITAQSQAGGTIETYDPNYDPNDASVFSKMIALNLSNSAGTSLATEFNNLMSNGGTINLTQNGQVATYSTNQQGEFFVDPNGWFVIPAGIQTTSTDGPFVFGTPITVSIS